MCFWKNNYQSLPYLARGQKIPSADYEFSSCAKSPIRDLFDTILKEALKYVKGDDMIFAPNDNKIRKKGKKIPYF